MHPAERDTPSQHPKRPLHATPPTTRDATKPVLSIIIPFFNSSAKASAILRTLVHHLPSDAEAILVDDGSTDATPQLLAEVSKAGSNIVVVSQENRGPGGARNAGLGYARGEYVWFVDSDDDIYVDAIPFIREHSSAQYDFIDFNYDVLNGSAFELKNYDSMQLAPGEYVTPTLDTSNILVAQLTKNLGFGRLVTKVWRRKFLLENGLFFPEYCLYEDTPLAMIIPNYVKSFLKAPMTGYICHREHDSVTRTSGFGPRFFDRLWTAEYGYRKAVALASTDDHVQALRRWFIKVFLFFSIFRHFRTAPLRSLSVTIRVMRFYRDVARELGIFEHPLALKPHNWRYGILFRIAWTAAPLMPPQRRHFARVRSSAWPRPIKFKH